VLPVPATSKGSEAGFESECDPAAETGISSYWKGLGLYTYELSGLP
jgi:hypothetical protein